MNKTLKLLIAISLLIIMSFSSVGAFAATRDGDETVQRVYWSNEADYTPKLPYIGKVPWIFSSVITPITERLESPTCKIGFGAKKKGSGSITVELWGCTGIFGVEESSGRPEFKPTQNGKKITSLTIGKNTSSDALVTTVTGYPYYYVIVTGKTTTTSGNAFIRLYQ